MESLTNYIGLSSKVSEVESGLYLDALPDISLTIANAITDKEDDTIEVWNTIQKRGILKFRTLFINAINKCHSIRKIDVCECLIEENFELFGIALWYLLGAEFMLERYTTSRINRFTTIDKAKAKELQASFMQVFTDELEIAINSIDIHETECTDEVIPEHNIITTHYVLP